VADEITRSAGPDRAYPVVGDITKLDDCERILEQSLARFGTVEVLVNNARYESRNYPMMPFWKREPDFYQNTINTNVNGTFLISRTITPHLIAQGWGRIVNLSTSLSTMLRAKFSPYGVSKAALESATVIWSKDLEGTGVTVNALLPGAPVETGEPIPADRREGRTLFLPCDIMNPVIIWLASDLSDGKTGGRYVCKNWDPSLPPNEAAEKSLEPVFRVPAPET
jgi:NAD(P)-dependent dehydrogenase (short-subunit alcohol dehydrogenase family)